MGTTLANLHVLNVEVLYSWMPDATIGRWSRHYVSLFSAAFLPELVDKKARSLSKKVPQPVLSAWLSDDDAVGISVFQRGRTIAAHISGLVEYSRMGNIPLFCQTLNLPEEDVSRLRTVWKKGSAEEQLLLTADLLGVPLYHDSIELPDRQYARNADAVDRWIRERPAPPKIRNTAKAALIQELPQFRCKPVSYRSPFHVSVDPYDNQYAYDRYHLWKARPDGTLGEIWTSEKYLRFFASDDRIICTDFYNKTVEYDSSVLLPRGYPICDDLLPLEDGRILQTIAAADERHTFLCCAPDGAALWWKDDLTSQEHVFAWNERELVLSRDTKECLQFVRMDLASGREIETLDRSVGLDAYQKRWHSGAWWITHDGRILENGVWKSKGNYQLTKLDGNLRKLSTAALPSYTQDVFFSPDNRLVYVFLYQSQILAMDADHLTVENTLNDKAFLMPLGFDGNHPGHRFWLQRNGSTVEAWDSLLTKTLSRHRLKGEIVGCHRDQYAHLCVSTWDERKRIFRIYRLV